MKKSYIELLRVIAIVLVVFNHTRSLGYSLYANTTNHFTYWISLAASLFCKVAVPLFFMISGGVLLGKKESISLLYRKRVLRIILVILIFVFLQYLRIVRVHPEEPFRIGKYLDFCINGNIIEPYWFLKAYLGMLICLPLLRVMAAGMEKNHYVYLFVLRLILMILSLVFIYTRKIPNAPIPILDDILFYPLMGYYLSNHFEEKGFAFLKKKYVSSVLLVLVLGITTFFAGTYFSQNNQYTEIFHTISAWLMAILFFITVQKVKMICAAGACTFGVYLIEDVTRNQFVFLVPILSRYIGNLLACILFVFISVLVGMIAIYIVKKLPLINKLI